MFDMRRREFITFIGGAAAAWPLAARAQQSGKIYRIGFLANDPAIPTQPVGQAFLDGLRGDGFIEGKISSSSGALPREGSEDMPTSWPSCYGWKWMFS
jgi:hypothetical protein